MMPPLETRFGFVHTSAMIALYWTRPYPFIEGIEWSVHVLRVNASKCL